MLIVVGKTMVFYAEIIWASVIMKGVCRNVMPPLPMVAVMAVENLQTVPTEQLFKTCVLVQII